MSNKVLNGVLTNLKNKTLTYGFTYGEAVKLDNKAKKALVNNVKKEFFGEAMNTAKAESGISTNAGINAKLREGLLDNLVKEYEARAESVLIGSQTWGAMNSDLTTQQQLMLLALAPAIIEPVHNKAVKTIVTKELQFVRKHDYPFIKGANGEVLDFIQAVNSKDALLKISTNGGQPVIRAEVPVTAQQNLLATDTTAIPNLCEIFNKEQQLKNPAGFRLLQSDYDFIRRGVKIVELVLANDKRMPVTYITTGVDTQSGQLDTTAANINAKFTIKKDGEKDVELRLVGSVDAKGDVNLVANKLDGDNELKAVVFEFVVPSKGAQQPLQVIHKPTHSTVQIEQKETFVTTLNNQLADDAKNILNIDLVEQFNKDIVTVMNSKKDQYLLKHIEDHINKMKSLKSATTKLVNEGTVLNRMAEFAYSRPDMSEANAGYQGVLTAHNDILAIAMRNVCTEIDQVLNPKKKEFTVLSSTSASQWLHDAEGQPTTKLNIVGDAVEGGELAGMPVSFSMKRIKMGPYGAKYLSTNRLSADTRTIEKEVVDNGGNKVSARAREHRFTILPNFEENMDGFVFFHGLEYISNGVGHPEYNKDLTLNYESRYEVASFNKSIAVVDFVEAPTDSYIGALKK